MKTIVTFLKSGGVTWVSKSGKTECRRYIRAGTKMELKVGETEGDSIEFWDGNWSVLIPAKNVRQISDHFTISFDVYKGTERISVHVVRDEKEKQEVLKPLRRIYGKVEVRNERKINADSPTQTIEIL